MIASNTTQGAHTAGATDWLFTDATFTADKDYSLIVVRGNGCHKSSGATSYTTWCQPYSFKINNVVKQATIKSGTTSGGYNEKTGPYSVAVYNVEIKKGDTVYAQIQTGWGPTQIATTFQGWINVYAI